MSLWGKPIRPQRTACFSIIGTKFRVMADAGHGYVSDQLASDRLVEGIPFCGRGPTRIPGKAAACTGILRCRDRDGTAQRDTYANDVPNEASRLHGEVWISSRY